MTTFDSGGSRPVAVASGDLNGDGKIDLAVANKAENWQCVGVLYGNGRGSFGAARTYAPSGDECESVAIGDFDRDGTADIAVGMANGYVSVLSMGSVRFGRVSDFGNVGSFITAANINHDGRTSTWSWQAGTTT